MLLFTSRRTPTFRDGFPVLPGGWPLIGHMVPMARDQLNLLRKAEKELGQFFWIFGGVGEPALFVCHPEIFNAFRNRTTSSEVIKSAKDFLGQSLLVHDGDVHARMRNSMNGPFTPRGLSGNELGPLLAEIIEGWVARWTPGQELTILNETKELTLNALFRMIGAPVEELAEWRHQYTEFMYTLMLPSVKFPGTPAWRGARAGKWLDTKVGALIERVRQNPEPGKLLTQIVMGKDESGNGQTERELLDNLRLLVLAGHETTASTMAWMTVALGRDRNLWDRLVEEANGASGLPKVPSELKAFQVAEGIFRESLRMHPPATLDGRLVTGEFSVAGRTIPVGTPVTIPILLLSRNPEVYPDPDTYNIDRWVNRKEPISPLHMVQFGGGPHFCLGYHVAWMESVQFAVALARQLSAKGLRPLHEGPYPTARYMPLMRPDAATRIKLVKA